MSQTPKETPSFKKPLVPLDQLGRSDEIDDILRQVLKGDRKQVHAAIEAVLKGWPGRKRGELWSRLRQLRMDRAQAGQRHTAWDQDDLEILRRQYAQGRSGARKAVRETRARRPELSASSVWHKAAELGMSTGSGKSRPWSREEQGALLWDAGEKPVEKIARKLGRSVKAVRQMLSRQGVSSRVRMPNDYSLRGVGRLLGVDDKMVRLWFQKGWFGEVAKGHGRKKSSPSAQRIGAAAIVAFCRERPDKINTAKCHRNFWLLMEDKKVEANAWLGHRQHLTSQRQCPGCGRAIRGNAYFRHLKRCVALASLPWADGLESQASAEG